MTKTIINICIPLYNRGNDITKLIHNINDISKIIDKINIILKVHIGDYHSTDVDLYELVKQVQINTNIIQIDGKFNLAKSLQLCSDTVTDPNELIMHIDADTVLENGLELFKSICNQVIQGKTFYCPIVSTEGNPSGWPRKYNGKVYVPTRDHFGKGLIVIYNSDYKKSNGFIGSEFMKQRGEIWGSHEIVLEKRLKFLNIIRPITSDIWLRDHKRNHNTTWY